MDLGSDMNVSLDVNPSASDFIPRTPPQFLSSHLTFRANTGSITPLSPAWKDFCESPSSRSSNKVVKFIQNVHFPKDLFAKCLNVLPPDVSLAHVKYQPQKFQKWFHYLKERELDAHIDPLCAVEEAICQSSPSDSRFEDTCFIESEKSAMDPSKRSISKTCQGGFVSSMTKSELDN